jgi:hypothetical protein
MLSEFTDLLNKFGSFRYNSFLGMSAFGTNLYIEAKADGFLDYGIECLLTDSLLRALGLKA